MSGLPWYPERKPRPAVTSQIESHESLSTPESMRSAIQDIDILLESEPAATWERFIRNARLAEPWEIFK